MMTNARLLLISLTLFLFVCKGESILKPNSFQSLHLLPNSRLVPSHLPGSNGLVFQDKPESVLVAAADGSAPVKKDLKATIRSLLPILCSAFTAAAIMYPLDLVRALQMANAGSGLTTGELLANFQKAHGWQGFFTQGLVPELARSTWMRFIKFALFPIVHVSLHGIPDNKGNEFTKAVAAIVSSIPEAISIMPLEVSKIALQLDTTNRFRNNMFNAMGDVVQKQGLGGLMVGYLGIQYRQAAWSAGYFASIKFFEKHVDAFFTNSGFQEKYPKASKTISRLFSGFLAGVFGACLNTPGDTIRSNLQKRIFQGQQGLTFFSVGNEIIKSKGVGALYAGFKFKAFHLGGGGALMAFLIPFFTNLFSEKK